ncbi:hypothetical protein AALP_AA4G151900 [Arabis alpina]|uniref:RING-type domain-containing protein n=1 Tax=Arabis alpina TaxID=50452 RepID=A0A087H3E5_ARAAL|nr:hypothetical protein AALP_AA4G151900 [Arabis alpina]
MFNNTTTFSSGAGAVVPIPSTTIPTTTFPGSTITSNSTFINIGPPPPFPAPPRSIDLSPLKLIFAVIAIIAVPALAFALFFAVPCSSSSSRRRTTSSDNEETPHITVELPPPVTADTATVTDPGVKFQKETHSKEIGNECTVCLSVFTDGEEIRRLSACEHAFHVSCIEMWLKDHPNCPICRADVAVKQTEHTVNVNGNSNGNANRSSSGGNRRVSATSRDDDWRQGLPDASSLV